MASLFLVCIEGIGNLLDRLVVAGVRAAQDHEDADSVLVDVFADQLCVKAVVRFGTHGDDARFHFEVSSESV